MFNRGSGGLVDLVESGKLGVLPASEVATLDEQELVDVIRQLTVNSALIDTG